MEVATFDPVDRYRLSSFANFKRHGALGLPAQLLHHRPRELYEVPVRLNQRCICRKGTPQPVLTAISLNKAVILEGPENARGLAFVEARRDCQLSNPPFTPLNGKEF